MERSGRGGGRPRTQRRGARVLLREHGRVLLLADRDPGVEGSGWWVLPGGGVDAGEGLAAAAVREVHEETGLLLGEDALRGPVAHRVVTHGYSDRVLVQEEWIFVADVARFDFHPAGLTAGEKVRLAGGEQGWGWFDAAEVARMTVWPTQTLELMAATGDECREYGAVEESTVPA